ncbi:MAG: ParB-like nuclease domain-containing protein [Deltaproteobacteria bacterium]|nr:ParB-like nuclease domain-containing protein [Deltaproteobacteria bacterium]
MSVHTEFIDVDPRRIVIPGGRVRAERDEDADVSMDESMQRWGILQEPACRREGDSLILIYGEGRVRKAIEAGQQLIRVKVFDIEPYDAELISLSENLARGQIRPGQFVVKIKDLVEKQHMSPGDIAKLINRPTRWVNEIIKVSKLPTEIVEDVVIGTFSLEAAKELTRVEDQSKQLEAYRLARQGNWSSEALHQFIDRWAFKLCDVCHRPSEDLKKVGGELLCPDCIRAKYPVLADTLERPEGVTPETRQALEPAAPEALAREPSPVFPCHLCGVGKPQEDLVQVVVCRDCLAKIDMLMKMFEVQTGKLLRELTKVQLRGFEIVEKRP